MNEAVIEYYRCPRDLIEVGVEEHVSEEAGFFRFGRETICYGHSASGFRSPRVDAPLYDVSADVSVRAGSVRLPFDPDRVVDNLRLERYRGNGNGLRVRHGDSVLVRTLYYSLVRPLLTTSLRQDLQRAILSDWRQLVFPRWPVDGTVERILERVLVLVMQARGLDRIPFIWFWPDGATGCVIMTHDVEDLRGRDFCPPLMDLDDGAGIKASFQVIPEGRYPVSDGFVAQMRARGFEVNIHDLNHDGRLFSSREEFVRRAARINAYGRQYGARGFRSGGLYRSPAWYPALDFAYDMSIPSVAHLDPQRGGCCALTPFFIGELLELPLTTLQDYSLLHVLNEYSIALWKQQAEAIVQRHGLASFLVHPDYVIEPRARRVYQDLLAYLAELRERRNVWIALPGEVDRWWRERSHMRVERHDTTWSIAGRGAERARLAWATLDGTDLVYTLDARA